MCQSSLRTAVQRVQRQTRSYYATARLLSPDTSPPSSRLPRVAHPSFWASLIPSFLRRPTNTEQAAQRARVRDAAAHERRVGLVFLALGILVGSNAINIISVRRDMLNFTRHTDAKLELLRDIVHRVKNGHDVDVQAAMGTGDGDQEKEWEQLIHELENTDMLSQGRKKRDAKRAQRADKSGLTDGEQARATQDVPAESSSASELHKQKGSPKFLM